MRRVDTVPTEGHVGLLSLATVHSMPMSEQGSATNSSSVGCLIVTCVRAVAEAQRAEQTFRQHHPEALVRVVVVDDRFGEACRGKQHWQGLRSEDRELARLMMSHDPVVVQRAVVPSVALATMAELGVGQLLSIPDDSETLRPFPLDALRNVEGLHVFRVRQSDPPSDGRLPDQRNEIESGTVDQRCFLVGGPAGQNVLREWAAKLARNPLENSDHFDAVDTNWLDVFALRLDDVFVHPPCVGSYRNADELPLDKATVFRFPAFRVDRPWILSTFGGEWPRIVLSDHPELEDLVRTRTAAIALFSSSTPGLQDPYGRLPNGHSVDSIMRSLYRSELVAALREGQPEPPNPFVVGEAQRFSAWLAEAVDGPLSRYLVALRRSRPDIGALFANDPDAYILWARRDAVRLGMWAPNAPGSSTDLTRRSGDAGIDAGVDAVGDVSGASTMQTEIRGGVANASGVNVVGLLSAQLGIGESGRLTLHTLRDSKVPFSIVDHDATVSKRDSSLLSKFVERPTGFPFDVDLLLVNADQTEQTLASLGRGGRRERPTIGLWAWEVQQFPERMHSAFAFVDEVWAMSDFARDALQGAASRHGVGVHTFPMRLPEVTAAADPRQSVEVLAGLGLKRGVPFFTFAFDYFSVAERKQPWAVVEAFRRAFPHERPNGPCLVLKSINHEYRRTDRERLLYAIGGRSDVIVIERYLPAAERDALIRGAAAYVSLHRAEGFGLTLAEAMSVGTPTISTGWSGNMQFMNDSNSFLVPCQLIDISADTPVYAGLGQWADPDLDVAAQLMQRVLEDPVEARRRADQAALDVMRHNSSGADVAFLLARLRAVRQHSSTHDRSPFSAANRPQPSAFATTQRSFDS